MPQFLNQNRFVGLPQAKSTLIRKLRLEGKLKITRIENRLFRSVTSPFTVLPAASRSTAATHH